ncbi:MAG TPA: hypothetical protein VEF34_02450 [Syntrophobacteraceae bacterium]|nr:hypothetical protein [Syntrophobacteraceae bacterium]
MSKTLILAIALSLVLVSGSLFSAQAACGCLNPCNWHFPSLCSLNWNPCNWHFPCCGSKPVSHAQDMNKPVTTQAPQNQAPGAY